jgi:hypothetical protein
MGSMMECMQKERARLVVEWETLGTLAAQSDYTYYVLRIQIKEGGNLDALPHLSRCSDGFNESLGQAQITSDWPSWLKTAESCTVQHTWLHPNPRRCRRTLARAMTKSEAQQKEEHWDGRTLEGSAGGGWNWNWNPNTTRAA